MKTGKVFESYIYGKFKKEFPFCRRISMVHSIGDFLVGDLEGNLFILECKDWAKYSFCKHRKKQPKQFFSLSRSKSFIIVKDSTYKDLRILNFKGLDFRGSVNEIINKIKEDLNGYIDKQ